MIHVQNDNILHITSYILFVRSIYTNVIPQKMFLRDIYAAVETAIYTYVIIIYYHYYYLEYVLFALKQLVSY